MDKDRKKSARGRGAPRKKSAKKSRPGSAGKIKKEKPKFPVAEIHAMLAGEEPLEKVDPQVPLFIASVEEYVALEILELARNHAINRGSNSISADDVIDAVKDDEDLNNLFGEIIDNEINKAREENEKN